MKQFKYEFEVDTEGKVVRFAGRHFDKPRMVSTRELMRMFGYHGISKYNCQKFNEEFGITPVNLRKKLNATIRKIWIDPIEQEVKRYGFSYGSKLNPRSVQQIWENLDVIREVQEDGLDNLEPFAAILGKNPQQMKEIVGKSAWKQLCKNSRTRNTYIASALLRRGFSSVKTINSFPSWVLKQGYRGHIPFDDTGLWVLEQFKPGEARNMRRLGQFLGFRRMIMERSDTKRMANELGLKFSEKWDYPTIHKKHEEYTKLIEQRRFSKDVFDWAKDFKVKGLTHGDFEAILLDNAYAIAEEGMEMHHCVASYADASRSGDYLVYSILRKGERYSTLGIRVGLERINLVGGATLVVGGKYRLNQHYKACNKPVDNEEANELAEILITKLNTITREETAEEVK